MKCFTLSFCCILFLLISRAQTHEVGVMGGWLTGYPLGKVNSSNFYNGWRIGGYYQYAPSRWIGVHSGVYYENYRKLISGSSSEMKGAVMIPLNLVLFPGFRFSPFGGIYMRNMTGVLKLRDRYDRVTGESVYIQFGKRPAWGYEAGFKWNMRYCRLAFSCRQDLTSWMVDFEKMQWYSYFIKEPAKSLSCNATLEIPLWRKK